MRNFESVPRPDLKNDYLSSSDIQNLNQKQFVNDSRKSSMAEGFETLRRSSWNAIEKMKSIDAH
jgi:hypothetical protein